MLNVLMDVGSTGISANDLNPGSSLHLFWKTRTVSEGQVDWEELPTDPILFSLTGYMPSCPLTLTKYVNSK